MPNLKLLKIKSEMALRRVGNKFGVDVKMTDEEILMKQLKHNGIDLIFDIGANTGQFGEMIYKLGYGGKMVSFEPLSEAHAALVKRCEGVSGWTAAERCAVGDSDGEIEIHVSENLLSSSALDMLSEHEKAAPDSKYVATEKTKVYKLDSLFGKYLNDAKNVFVKIDTQGFEEKILNGCAESLPRIKGFLIEMSLVKLYEGQALFDTLYPRMLKSGFELYGIEPAFVNKETGRMLQVDAVFFKP